ncbi:PREDICTED: hemicentin-1-like isoform X1 [Amphimedon queenslandica]|uniref:HMCN n=1 Tax=Amphimedon queenslandica TaxID=400682 RepID=A0AAN0JNC7_AMPQE|nr:PREDICTED: hemicentin-1-like isoform X1 [Amphimedon queenslandica]|eukprot:XP_019858316.1 PREDICTED: hemicentin-1-like isoform X1 [Amphimedon queenslandica]
MRSAMRCEAYGRPSPVITWRFNGNILTSEDIRRNITDSVNGYRVDSTLLIASTSSSDHGSYHCTAANVYGNATKLITNLNVLFAPVVTASPHTYNINVNLYNEVTLTCVSTSNPESRVIWVGEGGVLNDVCAGNSDDFNGAEAGIEYSQIENMFHDFSGDLGVASPSPSAHPRNCTINIGTTTQTFPVSTSVLTLGSLLHESSMNFVCVGTNDIGDSLSTASISLSLDASPYFSQIPLAIPSLYVGSTVEYNCSVISVTPVNITWLLDGIVIDEEILESKTQNETTSTLVLYDIEVDDAGRYTCHAKNDNGTSSRSFIQQIRVPVLSLTTDDNVVQGDDSIEMTCTGEGNPLPAITWSYTNEVTGETRNLTSPGYTINTVPLPDHDYQIESELILSNATVENAGKYTCTATSAFQDQSTSTNVKVLVPAVISEPSSDQKPFSPILGATDFTILCAATGVSAPNVSIIRLSSNQSVGTSMKMKQLDTGLILSETSLVFNTVTSDAEGLYECQASNELAQLKHSFVVSVDDNTIFNTEFQVIDIVIESNLTISCNITTHASDPVINWYHSGVKLGTDTERVYASSSSSVRDGLTTLVSTLTISDVEVSDGGNYVCEVVNTHGSYNESISQVNVQVPPSVSVSPSNLTYIQGINANLSCIGTGPPLPSLQFDGVNCSPSSGPPILMHGNRFSGHCQTVGDSVIVSLTVSDITELGPLAIECSATNPAGDDTVLETIFITGLSLTATQPENISIPDGGFHTFSCAAQGYPLPDIQWGSENNLSLNHDITVDHVGQFGIISNLTIYNYTASNEGEYHCIAKNQYYEPVSSTTVVSTKYIAPSIITKLTTETVTINDNISIICTATGLPPPTVSWMKGGIPTMGNNLVSEVAVNIDGTPSVTTSTLTLAGVTLTDEGEYTCIASSPEFSGTVERIVKNITIIVPPVASIYPSSLVHFIPGHNNSLICAGTGKPAPTVSISGYQCFYANTQSEWTVNGIIIRCNAQQVGGIYSISMYYTLTEFVTDFSPHNVTCLAMSSAFDTVETATSLVQYQVYESVLTQAPFVTLPEGATFNISCTSTGYPHPTLDWLYGDDNGAIVYNDRHIRSPDEPINAYTVQSILTVKDLIPADAGEYKCRAQYSSGHLVHATSLAVTPFNDCASNPCVNGSCTDLLKDYTCSCNNLYIGKNCSIKKNITSEAPNITENPANVTEAFLFGSFNVTCEAVAMGGFVQYSWLRDNVKLDESGDVLFISEAVPEDRGYYTCVAENEAGNSTSQPGLVVIPGLYQYVAAISTQASKATGQLVNIENITVAMGECLSYDVLPEQKHDHHLLCITVSYCFLCNN